MLELRWYIGKLLNFFRFASPIRECDYTVNICKAHITVRQNELFTIVSVNGLDVYFHRLTGQIDGVGFIPTVDCTQGAARELTHLDAPPPDEQATVPTGIQSG